MSSREETKVVVEEERKMSRRITPGESLGSRRISTELGTS
jgi:hypothetical protein